MTTDGAVTTTAATPATTAGTPSSAPRVFAGLGVAFLVPMWFVCAMLTLQDAHQGKGVGGPLIDAGFAALWPSLFLGIIALLLPGAALTPKVRILLVRAQYALLLLAPVLILLDGNS